MMKRGFILILTLVVISLLTIGVVGFNYWVRTKNIFANNQIFALKTLYLAKAGINYGIFVLREDKEKESDNLNEDWAKIEPFDLGEGVVTVKIIDEQGKININEFIKSKKTILARLFNLLDLESGKLDAIADWIDRDNIPRATGAEEDYYANLQPPYSCKNAPLDTIGELIMVKGINKQILYDDEKGLVNFLTVASASDHKNETININTAPLDVLEAILGNHTLAEDIINQREEKSFTGMPEKKGFSFVSTSNIFSLESTGAIPPHYKKKIKAIVRRNPLKILYYKVE